MFGRKKSKSNYYYASFITIVIFFLSLIVYLPSAGLDIQGDGNEYVLQTAAFENHFSFGITEKDLNQAKQQFYMHQDSLQITYDNILHDERGIVYSNHFGAYSVLVTIVKFVLLACNIYPLWAFCLTNYILWLAAALVIFFFLKIDDKRKFCILILTLFHPAFFYLHWVHTEIYIFAFEIIGLVFLYNKQHSLSILALSVSAMQNLGVLPLAAAAGLDYICCCYGTYKENNEKHSLIGFVKSSWKKIVPYGIFYVPAFLPIITTYIRFGTYNLVAAAVMEDKYLLHKAFDYVFDLNLGILPYEPFLLICFFIGVIYGSRKFLKSTVLNVFAVGGMLFIIAHQLQINSGMQGIMRYCVWIIPVLIFYVVVNWPYKNKEGAGLVMMSMAQAVFTGLLVSYCTWWGGGYSNGQFAPWTEVLLDAAPWSYNPTHGIFYSRANGGESYYSAHPVVYTNKDGYIRKILLSTEAEEEFYSDDQMLMNTEGEVLDKRGLKAVPFDEGDFSYINITDDIFYIRDYELGECIFFYSDKYNASEYVQKGLSYKEEWGSWTDGEQLIMKKLRIDTDAKLINMQIETEFTFCKPQDIEILNGDIKIYEGTVSGGQTINIVFEKPENNIIDMKILLPDAVEAEDMRKLGVGLKIIKLGEADSRIADLPDHGEIRFDSENYNAEPFVLSGISEPEKDASWTNGKRLILMCRFPDYGRMGVVHCEMELQAVFQDQQRVVIKADEEICYSQTVEPGTQQIVFEVPKPEDGLIYLDVELPDAVSPLEVGMSEDPRKLALMIKRLTME